MEWESKDDTIYNYCSSCGKKMLSAKIYLQLDNKDRFYFCGKLCLGDFLTTQKEKIK
jgi:predicted SprT family Zn-dependent metalloprotease